jgi:predicted ATP-grasp superfamily ATP-dependent carboligase
VTFKLKDVDWQKVLGRKSPVEKLVEEAEDITERSRQIAKKGKRVYAKGKR